MKLLALMLGALVLTGAAPPNWLVAGTYGLTIRYPAGWEATSRPLTAVEYPAQRLALASYSLQRVLGTNDCAPTTALAQMPANGVIIFVSEDTLPSPLGQQPKKRDFPPRPKEFKLGALKRYECFGPSYRLAFREAGRYFQVQLVIGPGADREMRATALRILNSFSAKPF